MPTNHRERSAPASASTATTPLEEILDLITGLNVLLLPLLVTSLPGVLLLLIAPAVLLAAAVAIPVAIVAALLAPLYVLVRRVRRRD